ncbi:hypothetical protein [Herbaspirillum aquaticum]|uniref:Uncharacterized protein n=1 Tax=Herbaspirillum aquaticum TaxID=568783 RepID=A0A225SVP3_9BURK|nr:hypothetical protein [Herbaspirillum aquaticum]OWY35292.1 hypothetical protein CEJ45_08445 [Herbaspirillum aquaticum]
MKLREYLRSARHRSGGVITSMAIRTKIPYAANNFGTNPYITYRMMEKAIVQGQNINGGFANVSVWSGLANAVQEIANISPVYVTAALVQGVSGSALDQSAATLTPLTWQNAYNGVPGYLYNAILGRAATSAEFIAAGATLSGDKQTLLVPPGFLPLFDTAPLTLAAGRYAIQFEIGGAPQLTLTIPNAATYPAGTPIPFTGTTPATNWGYLATGTGITAVTAGLNDATGTVATFDGTNLTLSKSFTSTAGQTIQLNSRYPACNAISNATLGDATTSSATGRKCVFLKNWTAGGGVTGVTQASGTSYTTLLEVSGTNSANAPCFAGPGDSICNDNHDQNPDNSWGDADGAQGIIGRACNQAGIPFVRLAVSGSKPSNEVLYGGNWLRKFMVRNCTHIIHINGHNDRALPWAGAAGVGFNATMQAWNNIYRNAAKRGAQTKVFAMTLMPQATGTFATDTGQTPTATSIDANGAQVQYRTKLLAGGFVPANGDPDVAADAWQQLYDGATAAGLSIVNAGAGSGKWPYSADWVSNSYRGGTLEGTHYQYTVSGYMAPWLAAQLPAFAAM